MMEDLNHDDLAHNLAQHLQQEARMVWENIPAGCAGNVRPDVYTLQKSFSSPNPITYEVKVSLSDFRSDVTTAKWKAYLRFSYGVVADKLHFIGEYPNMKKEIKALKTELLAVLGLDREDHWMFTRDVEHRIKQIRIMANETERKKAIAAELEKLKGALSADIDRVVRDYVPEETG